MLGVASTTAGALVVTLGLVASFPVRESQQENIPHEKPRIGRPVTHELREELDKIMISPVEIKARELSDPQKIRQLCEGGLASQAFRLIRDLPTADQFRIWKNAEIRSVFTAEGYGSMIGGNFTHAPAAER